MLFLAPLAFGAVEPWAWGTIGMASVGAFALWATGQLRRKALRIVYSPIYALGIGFLLLATVQYASGFTESRAGTAEAILKLAADFVIFFLAGQLWETGTERAELRKSSVSWRAADRRSPLSAGRSPVTARWRGRSPLTTLGILASVYTFSLALFAILQFFSSRGLIYWRIRPRWGGWVFGPYVNHNHFAGLMEMLIPLCAALALACSGKWSGSQRARESDGTWARQIWPWGAVLLGVISVMLSGSRGGLIALLAEGLLFLAILAAAGQLPRRRRVLAAVSASAAVLFFLWLTPVSVASRLATVAGLPQSPEATLGQRAAIAVDTLNLFRDHWVAGTGLGSYETAFPPYLSFPSDFTWEHAHNDYLEALADTGIAGGLLMAAALGLFLLAAVRRMRVRLDLPDASGQWIRLGAAVGCVGLLVHSLADFNLHIPANVAWFALLAGLVVAGAQTSREASNRRSR